jgi:hypothetical protein
MCSATRDVCFGPIADSCSAVYCLFLWHYAFQAAYNLCGHADFHFGANMHKAIIACFAIAFLTSPLHAESPGSAALKGATKGAAGGAGGQGGGGQGGGGQNDPAQQFQQIMNQLTQARKNPQPSTGPKGAGSTGGTSQTKGRR